VATRGTAGAAAGGARERLVAAAYELFSTRGVQATGIDAIIARSGVARQSMYRHFASKQDLVLAFLERREAKHIPVARLGATDDCGFSPFSRDVKPQHGSPDFARDVAMQKISARLEGARLASAELGV